MQLSTQASDTIADKGVERLNSSLTLETWGTAAPNTNVNFAGRSSFQSHRSFRQGQRGNYRQKRPTVAPTGSLVIVNVGYARALATLSEIAPPDFAKHVTNVDMIVGILNAPIPND